MKYIYSIITLFIVGILEYFGITMVDKIDKYINNKVLSSAIVILYCIIGFIILVLVQIKLGIFSEN